MNNVEDHPLDMRKDELYKYILQKAGCPKDVTDINLLFEHMKNLYRGQKRETLYLSKNTSDYYNTTMSYNKLSTLVKAKDTTMRQQVTALKTNLSNITLNDKMDKSVKKRAMKHATNASMLYNFYSSVLSIYIELKIEKILAYRIVLRKLYRV
jgi:hypothetical protein